jgi:hypothetical protein
MDHSDKKRHRRIATWAVLVAAAGFVTGVVAFANDILSLWDRLGTAGRVQVYTTIPTMNSNIPILGYFPLFAGSTRSYHVTGSVTPDEGGPATTVDSNYTEKIVMIDSGSNDSIHIYHVEQVGGAIFDLDCTGFETRPAPARKWYITDRKHVYVACDRDELNQTIQQLMIQNNIPVPTSSGPEKFPILTLPLVLDNKWQAFLGYTPSDSPDYQWYVEAQLPYVVPAGEFLDCYRIVLYTLPEVSIRYFCNGVGIVAMEYHHNGTPVDYRVELISYSKPGNP